MVNQLPAQASHAGHKPHKVKPGMADQAADKMVKNQLAVNALAVRHKPMAITATTLVATEPTMANQRLVAAKIANKANKQVASAVATSSAVTQHHVQLNRQVLRFKLKVKYLSLISQA